MTERDEISERMEWLSAEVYQLIYQRVRDMKHPVAANGECVFCGHKVQGQGRIEHDIDCLAAEAANAEDKDVNES